MRKKRERTASSRSGVRDVAKLAGVSPATVSRVLNQSEKVNPQTRARIQAVLDSVNYVRDGIARSLTSKRSGNVAVIVPALGNSVYSDAVDAIERRLQVSRYHLLTASSGYDPRREYELARTLIEHGVDGLILVGNDHVPELHDLVTKSAVPAIQTFTDDPTSKLPCVGFDNDRPLRDLVSFVIGLGHREFAVLHSPIRHNDRIATRLRAILGTPEERGMAVPADRIIEAGYTVAEGRAGMRALLSGPQNFTAVACTGDVLAVGAVIEARSKGVDIPGDLSITGFHDYDMAAQIEPPLTTVHAPVREMSVAAAEYLLSCISGENPPRFRQLPTALVVRKSAGPVPVDGRLRPAQDTGTAQRVADQLGS